MLCGLLPAWHGARTNLEEALREGGRGDAPGGRSLGWHRLLVVAQVALCFVLLVCAGLLARTFHHLKQNPIGFRHDGVLAMTFDLPGGPTRVRPRSRRARAVPRSAAHSPAGGAGRPVGGVGGPIALRGTTRQHGRAGPGAVHDRGRSGAAGGAAVRPSGDRLERLSRDAGRPASRRTRSSTPARRGGVNRSCWSTRSSCADIPRASR